MALASDLYTFSLAHRWCGELESDVDEDRVWMTCMCGARIEQKR